MLARRGMRPSSPPGSWVLLLLGLGGHSGWARSDNLRQAVPTCKQHWISANAFQLFVLFRALAPKLPLASFELSARITGPSLSIIASAPLSPPHIGPTSVLMPKRGLIAAMRNHIGAGVPPQRRVPAKTQATQAKAAKARGKAKASPAPGASLAVVPVAGEAAAIDDEYAVALHRVADATAAPGDDTGDVGSDEDDGSKSGSSGTSDGEGPEEENEEGDGDNGAPKAPQVRCLICKISSEDRQSIA